MCILLCNVSDYCFSKMKTVYLYHFLKWDELCELQRFCCYCLYFVGRPLFDWFWLMLFVVGLDGFNSFIRDQVTVGVLVHFWLFSSISMIYLPVSESILYSFNHGVSVK